MFGNLYPKTWIKYPHFIPFLISKGVFIINQFQFGSTKENHDLFYIVSTFYSGKLLIKHRKQKQQNITDFSYVTFFPERRQNTQKRVTFINAINMKKLFRCKSF